MKSMIVIPAIAVALLAGCPVVSASPYPDKERQLCNELGQDSTENGVLASITRIGLTTPGINAKAIADITVDAVTQLCPQYQQSVLNVMQKYNKGTFA